MYFNSNNLRIPNIINHEMVKKFKLERNILFMEKEDSNMKSNFCRKYKNWECDPINIQTLAKFKIEVDEFKIGINNLEDLHNVRNELCEETKNSVRSLKIFFKFSKFT